MPTDFQLNFRDTALYVTDGAGQTAVLNDGAGNGIVYPTTVGAITFGWEDTGTSTRDRSNTADPRLAGNHFGGSGKRFRVDLPATGSYEIHFAGGDALFTGSACGSFDVKDNTTVKFSIAGATANRVTDANSVEHTSAANWIANETGRTATFASTILRLVTTGGGNNFVQHLRIKDVADTTPPTSTSLTIGTNGTTVTFGMSEATTIGAGGNGGAAITMSGGAATLTYASGSGTTSLVYTSSRTILAGETGTGAYTQPANGWEDAAGNDVVTFSGHTVANNSTQAAPSVPSGLTASSGDTLVLLSWSASTGSPTPTYDLYRSTSSGSEASYVTGISGTTYSDTSVSNGTTYYYKVRGTNSYGSSSLSSEASATPQTLPTIQYLLTSADQTALAAKVAGNTAQWQSFKARLDAQLDVVIETAYQGSQLPWIADFALGYLALKDSDSTTATKYAKKAKVLIDGAIANRQQGAWDTRLLLGRGDGVTTAYVLPDAAVVGATLKVFLGAVTTVAKTKGSANGLDDLADIDFILKVSNTSDGTSDYVQTTDWLAYHTYLDKLDWSPAGSEPSVAATYYVTRTDSYSAVQKTLTTHYTFNSGTHTVTFGTAPTTSQAVFAEYQYGSDYQQTGDGRGGFSNTKIDSGWTSRMLKFVAIGLDWLWDWGGIDSTWKNTVSAMLVLWCDWERDNGYTSPNYKAGHYGLRMAAACALAGRGSVDADRLKSEMETYHDTTIAGLLGNPAAGSGSYKGGFWPEGWNYGPGAIVNIILSGLAFDNVGWGDSTQESDWAADLITETLTEQPTANTIYGGGDNYVYPAIFPYPAIQSGSTTYNFDLFYALLAANTDATLDGYANQTVANSPQGQADTFLDLLYRDPNAAAASWSGALPKYRRASGTGLVVSRKDYAYNSTWLSFYAGNLATGGAVTGQGGLSLARGADQLLVLTHEITETQDFQLKTQYSNSLMVDDGAATDQEYSYAQGNTYGTPGIVTDAFEGTSAYTYVAADYTGAFRSSTGSHTNPVTNLDRSVLHVRGSDYVFVYDRVSAVYAATVKQVQWHFYESTTTRSGDAWTAAVGSSKLFGKTFSGQTLTSALNNLTLNGKAIDQITAGNTNAANCTFVTAMQSASSGTSAMDTAARIAGTNSLLEGAILGNVVAMFGKSGAVSAGESYAFTATNGATVTHYVADLAASTDYTLTGATTSTATTTAAGVLTFASTGTGSPQTIGVSRIVVTTPITVTGTAITQTDGSAIICGVNTHGGGFLAGTTFTGGTIKRNGVYRSRNRDRQRARRDHADAGDAVRGRRRADFLDRVVKPHRRQRRPDGKRDRLPGHEPDGHDGAAGRVGRHQRNAAAADDQ
jgi:fibronectin type 3 domain-containing protein